MKNEALTSWLSTVPGCSEVRIEPLCGGANNRVYRIRRAEAPDFLLKQYYHAPSDARDRLRSEYDFCAFAWGAGVRCIPRPVARTCALHLGLYTFEEGVRPTPGDVDEQAVEQALSFVRHLDEQRHDPRARSLGPASEACFSVAGHIACVERRVRRLCDEAGAGVVAGWQEVAAFVRGELQPAWERVRQELAAHYDEPAREAQLPEGQRCLSPSDFGFHNALIRPDGSLCFLDFEYAGWDDPAKLVGDFFSQVAVPVSRRFLPPFVEAMAALAPGGGAETARRAWALLPLYRIKWCCILLNEFVPGDRARRRFARREEGVAPAHEQLGKAARLLAEIKEMHGVRL